MDLLNPKLFPHRFPATSLGWPHTAVTAYQDDEHAPQTELQRKRIQPNVETTDFMENYLVMMNISHAILHFLRHKG